MEELGESLIIPDKHLFVFDRQSAKRWLVNHNEKYGSDMSAFILRTPIDDIPTRFL